MKNQMRVDVTLRFYLEGHLEGNQGKTKTILSFDIHIKHKSALKQTKRSYIAICFSNYYHLEQT